MNLVSRLRMISTLVLSFVLVAGQTLLPLAPVALLGTAVVTQTACPKADSVAKLAGEVDEALGEVIPIFQANGLSVAKLQEARTYAAKVKSAFEAGEITNAVQFTSTLISFFQTIVAEASSIGNSTTRTIVLVGLAVGNIALKRLANKLADEAPVVRGPMRGAGPVRTIEEFRKKPNWRCRDSITGQFRKMEVCKANPSTTTVETY
jgi:hypothetical protein